MVFIETKAEPGKALAYFNEARRTGRPGAGCRHE